MEGTTLLAGQVDDKLLIVTKPLTEPHYKLPGKIMANPIVSSGWDMAKSTYFGVKNKSGLLKYGLDTLESSVTQTVNWATPKVEPIVTPMIQNTLPKVEPLLEKLDQFGCTQLDRTENIIHKVQDTTTSVKNTTTKTVDTVKNTAVSTITTVATEAEKRIRPVDNLLINTPITPPINYALDKTEDVIDYFLLTEKQKKRKRNKKRKQLNEQRKSTESKEEVTEEETKEEEEDKEDVSQGDAGTPQHPEGPISHAIRLSKHVQRQLMNRWYAQGKTGEQGTQQEKQS